MNLICQVLTLWVGATFISQNAIAADSSGKAPRTCRFLFLAPQDNAPEKAYLHDGKESREVKLPSMNLSDVHELPAGDITLRLLPQPWVADQPLPPGAPAIALPQAIRDCYIIVASDPNNKVLPLRLQIIDANPAGFKNGQLMWFNLSPFAIGGLLGEERLNLKPKSQTIVDAPAKGFDTYPVTLGYQPETGKRVEPLCSTYWRHHPEARSVMFVVTSPTGKAPVIKGFTDSRVKSSEKEITAETVP
jgi:hypothetical protein